MQDRCFSTSSLVVTPTAVAKCSLDYTLVKTFKRKFLARSTAFMMLQVIAFGDKKIRVRERLGEGAYSVVYCCEDVSTGTKYALKRMLGLDHDQQQLAEIEIVTTYAF